MMQIDERLFQQEWLQTLPADARWLFLYILSAASRKTGIFEVNMRMLNFNAATEHQYTKEDLLKMYGNRIQLIPGHENTAIVVDYIATNWAKDGRQIDGKGSPLYRAIIQELARYGLTIAKLNKMANKKIQEVDHVSPIRDTAVTVSIQQGLTGAKPVAKKVELPNTSVTDKDAAEMFDAFWDAYPKSCPRKVDKKKCASKFTAIIKAAKDPVQMFNKIMNGLENWKTCATWVKDNGQFIRAPLVWLNGENWNDAPTKGGSHATGRSGGTANANYKGSGAAGIF